MLSKAKIKLIQSLEQKKKRKEEHLFVAEGPKVVGDLLPYFACRLLVATESWLASHPHTEAAEVVSVTPDELRKASFLKTPQEVLALFELPTYPTPYDIASKELCLALDDIQDPGNLGTIIRVADWFGIRHIFCSVGTTDAYSPKTVQASMGAVARVKIHYTDLPQYLHAVKESQPQTPLYGTFLEGESIYKEPLSTHGIIIMGNEGNGISEQVKAAVTHKLFIPNYPEGSVTSESLNVAIATAITCAEFRRRG
jgi:TrmH family RNA methyltransferase